MACADIVKVAAVGHSTALALAAAQFVLCATLMCMLCSHLAWLACMPLGLGTAWGRGGWCRCSAPRASRLQGRNST